MSRPILLLLIAYALSTTSLGACTSRTMRVPVPVVVTPPACVTAPPPVADPAVPVFGDAWVDYYEDLLAWARSTWRACRPAARSNP